jgi:hypothetical protein
MATLLEGGCAVSDPTLEVTCWLLTKADADQERAAILTRTEPFLAKLLLDDAKAARELAHKLNHDLPR